jgi:maleylacetoacetate isomerase
VRIGFALKDLNYDYVSVRDMGWDVYEKTNPHRLVPALQIGDALIPQSNAILHYLEEQFPDPSLFPADPVIRAQARAFAQHIVCEMHAVDVLRIRKFLAGKLNVDETGLEHWSQHWFADGFSKMEQALASRSQPFTFCYGEQPGWAELHLVPHMRKAITRFDVDVERYPIINEIFARCVDLPAFMKAAPASQPDYPGAIENPGMEN